jgi:hypothetical protein
MVVLSIPLGWLAMKRERHLRAVREISAAGGHVIYDHAPSGRWQQWPALWRLLSSSTLFDGTLWEPYQVSFYPANASDQTLAQLHHFRNTQVLVLAQTHITDAGLVHLTDFPQLKLLDLGDTRITDAGLVHLTSLKNLHILNLSGTDVTPEGIERLRQSLECEIYPP